MNRVFTVSLTRGLSKLSLLCHADATCRTVQRVSWRAPPGSPSGDFFYQLTRKTSHFVSYADVNSDINLNGTGRVGEVDIEPVTAGGGITYRF